jgi:hypothetical protein
MCVDPQNFHRMHTNAEIHCTTEHNAPLSWSSNLEGRASVTARRFAVNGPPPVSRGIRKNRLPLVGRDDAKSHEGSGKYEGSGKCRPLDVPARSSSNSDTFSRNHPITSAKLKQLAWAAKIRPETEVRLGKGGHWIPACRVNGLPGPKKRPQKRSHQQAKSTNSNQSPASGSVSPPRLKEKFTNPYQPPAFHDDLRKARPPTKSATLTAGSTETAAGLNRLYWVLSAIALWGVVQGLTIFIFMSGLVTAVPGILGGTVIVMTVIGKVGQIALAWQRLKNTGNNPWWSLASLMSGPMSSDSFLENWAIPGVGAITDVSRSVGDPASGGCAQALAVSPLPASILVSQTVFHVQCFGELPAIPRWSSAGSPFRSNHQAWGRASRKPTIGLCP